MLDDIVIFDKALSNSEITQVYAAGLTGTPQCPKPGNYAPVFSSSPVKTATEGIPYTYTATVSDYEGDGLNRSAVTLPTWLTFNTLNGLLSGTPGSKNVGDTIVRLQLSDGTSTVFQQFTITVANVEEAPEITSTPPATTINEDVPFSYTVVAVDNDPGDVVTLTGLQIPTWMTFNPTTGLLSGTPTNDQVQYSADSSFNVSIEARDKTDRFDTQNFTLKVINVNDAPVILSQNTVATDRNTPITLTKNMLNVEDVDDHYPSGHIMTIKPGTNYTYNGLNLTPAANYYGDLAVNISLSDGTATINYVLDVTVNFVNIIPEFKEGQIYTYAITVVDADVDDPVNPQTLTWNAEILPPWLSFDEETHVLAGVPNRAAVGDNPVKIAVNDGLETAYHEFVIVVEITNLDPIITSSPVLSVDNYAEYSYTITAVDPDPSDVLTFTAVPPLPSWLSFDGTTHILSGIPEKVNVGTHPVTLRVSDGYAEVDQTFTITVNNVNTAPYVTSDPMDTIKVDQLYTYLVVAVDREGNNLTYIGTSIPSWLVFDTGSKVLSGKPTASDVGDHTVIITISDGSLTYNHEFVITVIPKWPVGIGQSEKLVDHIYPNPADRFVIFELNGNESMNIEITDLSGKTVVLEKVDGAGRHTVDVAHLNAGLYMFRIYNENQMESGKLIIE
jgi:hypothetical protein